MVTETHCAHCAAEAAMRVTKIAHARRLIQYVKADVEHIRDCINADMPTDATLHAIKDALRLIDKTLTYCAN